MPALNWKNGHRNATIARASAFWRRLGPVPSMTHLPSTDFRRATTGSFSSMPII